MISLSLTPLFASAALENTQGLITAAKGIVSSLIVLAGGLALLYFVYGLAKFIRKASEGDVKEGKNIMMWGIIALFVMVSVWGIIQLLASDLGVQQNGIIQGGNGGTVVLPQGQITPCSGNCPGLPSNQANG